MTIVQQATGTFNGTSFTPTLPGASSASNGVVLFVAGNTTVTTPASWTSRSPQVANMGHYLFDRAGASLSSVAVSNSAGQGTWWIAEITTGTFNASNGANNTAAATTYATPTVTPTAGTRIIIASLGCLGVSTAITLSGWTNSFVEQADLNASTADWPMQGVAVLDNVSANGSTAYSTTGTYSASVSSRSAIIGAYVTTASGAPAIPPILVMQTRRAY